jgi:hypothetical protein
METLNLVEVFQKNIEKKKIIKKCEHGKRKTYCRTCGGSSLCIHDKVKRRCHTCGGSAFCEHGKYKETCRTCGGSAFCIHDKLKANCRTCGGTSFCIHDKLKANCRTCGGTSFCIHNKKKSQCRECNGSSFCIHNKQKAVCIQCGGSSICIHGKQKHRCIPCDGSSICIHKKEKSKCCECNGSAYCTHNKLKTRCIECDGSALCIHKIRKEVCRECNGSSFCQHDKYKSRCLECGGSALCNSEWCSTRGNPKYEGYCLFCFIHNFPDKPITRNYKTKEKTVSDIILESFPNFSWVLDKRIEGGCSKRRPDFLLDMGSHIIIVEVDENQHNGYDCENRRLMEISLDLAHRPIVFIRFNPDDYTKEDGTKIESCWKLNHLGIMIINKNYENEWNERIKILIEQINYWINNPSEKTIEIIQLFY